MMTCLLQRPGPRGATGPAGPPGPPGRDGTDVSLPESNSFLTWNQGDLKDLTNTSKQDKDNISASHLDG